jgi:hypothetical protein
MRAAVKLLISHPELAPGLVSALNETECRAARTGRGAIEVFVPWLQDGGDDARAAMELLFFVRAWTLGCPEFRTVLSPR